MSADKPFLDTNVLLYLLSADTAKAERAEDILRRGAVVSVQVLNEFVAVARRKAKLPLGEIREALAIIRHFCAVHAVDIEMHDGALSVCERFRLSIYDSLIVSAARMAGSTLLWSEDMQHGQQIDGVTIMNPFRA
jgi:predicted nucleic acid-binding protein